MSAFLSAFYFFRPHRDCLAAMIFGNLSYGFDDVAPMLGFASFLSGNLGDFEAGYAFKLSPNRVA
jgi:hypothetical protein